MTAVTWRAVAAFRPEFVQWCVQTYGPLPEGEINPGVYVRYFTAWEDWKAGR